MTIEPQIEKWKAMVQSEIARAGYPIPAEHALAIIRRESNGKAGALNPTGGDSGLMQLRPIALEEYNRNHNQKYTMGQLRGTSDESARIQIRVGLWILLYYLRAAYKYIKKRVGEVALDDLIKITDAMYAMGAAGARQKLDKVDPLTWDEIKRKFPAWHRIDPAEKIWSRANDYGANWSIESIGRWLEGQITDETKKATGGAILGILLIAIAWFYLSRRK